jgi:hypothetical protein
MSLFCRAAWIALAAWPVGAASVWADDLDTELGLKGNIVAVKVFHEDQTPAKGLKVALVDAQKNVIADGKINADGEWSWPAPGPGLYHVVLDPGTGDKDIKRYPIEVRPVALPSPEPDPDRSRCEHCPAPPAAPTGVASPSFPFTVGGVALGALALWGMVFWLHRACSGPSNPPNAAG